MRAGGLDVLLQQSLAPEPTSQGKMEEGEMEGKIAVSLWLGKDQRIALATSAREVA
jgi:hypothetical protein